MNSKNPNFNNPEVIVVEASAGGGKTRALAKRYLYLLLHSYFQRKDIALGNILAITFTNKATVEMKERIIEFIKTIQITNTFCTLTSE